MKQAILTTVILFSSVFSFGQAKPITDTIKTVLFYQDPISNELKLDFGYRIIKDTIRFFKVDPVTFKGKRVIDTSYFVPVLYAQLDDEKKPKFDSLGNQLLYTQFSYIPPSSVFVDGSKDVDEIIKKYYATKPKEVPKN